MQRNNKGSGKRVRTPLTPSGPKFDNGKKNKEPKETKVTTLILTGGLAVLAVIILAVAVLSFTTRNAPNINIQQTVEKTAAVTKEQAMDAVYLALFSFGLDKNSIKDTTDTDSDGNETVTMTIDPQKADIAKLESAVSEKLSELGMNVSTDGGVTAAVGKLSLKIVIKQQEAVKEPLPNSVAFVIDDCGYSLPLLKKLVSLPYPLTFAVIPYTPYAAETAKIIREHGKTVFLHQPMQPISYPKNDPGKGAIMLNMPNSMIKSWIDKNVENLGKIDGFNNHMGSALTQNREKMREVFKDIRPYTTTYVDSYTSAKSVAYDECIKAGFKCGLNRKFIDNKADYKYIRSMIIEGLDIARKDGSVIMIGHLHDKTVDALEKILPELDKKGYHIVSALELTKK